MIIGHHLMWTAYGWWLPNDPRGSMSRHVVIEPIAELGEHHYGRKVEQPRSREIREFYERAEKALTHELLTFDAEDVAILADSFARTIAEKRYTCYASAIMPDHVHLLIRKHRDSAEAMMENLQKVSREALRERETAEPGASGLGRQRLESVSADDQTGADHDPLHPSEPGEDSSSNSGMGVRQGL